MQRGYCKKNLLQIYLIGGAEFLNERDVFQVGKRNAEMVKGILRNYNLIPQQVDIGGNVSRTVYVDINLSQVTVKRQSMIL